MIQTVAWAATLLGWTGALIVGNGHRYGWAIALLAATAWLAVDAAFGIWAGVVASTVGGGIAARNWIQGARHGRSH